VSEQEKGVRRRRQGDKETRRRETGREEREKGYDKERDSGREVRRRERKEERKAANE
jgi:hypothetical protein